ncbi:hypothetical protein Baya_16318 [Bagarius yarrelli]|uniref:Uncharacterized protein n=1 Tax=Bagarius yarrelli TaxID=175774 RepID=A0A556VV27_BAGYA|nr:hypothetical protein Baya_16318 [Bagarius yarrelli]
MLRNSCLLSDSHWYLFLAVILGKTSMKRRRSRLRLPRLTALLSGPSSNVKGVEMLREARSLGKLKKIPKQESRNGTNPNPGAWGGGVSSPDSCDGPLSQALHTTRCQG